MKKIKIIDLLNKIANGEKIPTRFMLDGRIWTKSNDFDCVEYELPDHTYFFREYMQEGLTCGLNDEVEIIEDENKEANGIKKLNLTGENQLKLKTNKQEYNIRVVDKIIINKINEIIDKEY